LLATWTGEFYFAHWRNFRLAADCRWFRVPRQSARWVRLELVGLRLSIISVAPDGQYHRNEATAQVRQFLYIPKSR
jgi:hypothetical protein